MSNLRGTTIVAVKKNNHCAVAGDGQVTLGESTVFKHSAVKVRRIYNGEVVVGFAGGVADAFALYEKFEKKLEQFEGSLERSAVELAKEWRADSARKLEAMLIAANKDDLLIVAGTGEVLKPDDGVLAIGSGGNYAYAAATALYENTDMNAREIAEKAIEIASRICVYTNNHITVEEV